MTATETARTVEPASPWPVIRSVGVDGLLVSFGDRLEEPANRAALAYRAAVERLSPSGVEETSTSLVSVYVRFDPLAVAHADLRDVLLGLLRSKDWYGQALPEGRRRWRIPTVFGTDRAPQLAEAAAVAGMSEAEAIRSLTGAAVRVQTIGFAPGQPYLGELPAAWNIPRQSKLTPRVPVGALTVAIRQMVLFAVSTPTGWRHVGQTGFRAFRPDAPEPFVLRPGDEVRFVVTDPDEFDAMAASGPDGGATFEVIR